MKLFISYAQEQRPIAEEINALLSAQVFDVFFDKTDLRTGSEYDGTVREMGRESLSIIHPWSCLWFLRQRDTLATAFLNERAVKRPWN